jgi:hypothetical protein
VLAHGHQTELETLFDLGCYNYAAPVAFLFAWLEHLAVHLRRWLFHNRGA